MGSRGTITFDRTRIVGVFFDENNSRDPFHHGADYDYGSLLVGMPDHLLSLAHNEALQYVLQSYRGRTAPTITAAFWSDGEYLMAAEPWPEVLHHGAHLVSTRLLHPEKAISEWQHSYELLSSQVDLVRTLFERSVADIGTPVSLSRSEIEVLVLNGTQGLEQSRDLLAAVGIRVTKATSSSI